MPLITRRQALTAAAVGAVLAVTAKREDEQCGNDRKRENGTSRPTDTPKSGSSNDK